MIYIRAEIENIKAADLLYKSKQLAARPVFFWLLCSRYMIINFPSCWGCCVCEPWWLEPRHKPGSLVPTVGEKVTAFLFKNLL